MTDYRSMNVPKLRIAVRAAGWTGTDMLGARRDELVRYLETGKRPAIRYELEGDSLVLSRRPATIDELAELTERLTRKILKKSNKRERGAASGKRGRPKSSLPADTTPLVVAIAEAFRQGRPYRKTGARGVYENREELPAPFSDMSKHRLPALVDALLAKGLLHKTKDGDLITGVNFPEKEQAIISGTAKGGETTTGGTHES